ncbi:major capsid protein [Vogesella sp. AC12]|uniref:major capsid protein n=1 Tax=Vogesella sp. AC12 TaxID=2950550 RepID=UPI0021087A41|nr:major capsid protein [Vogesella sp. AC12]MCQ4143212.1 major capsid protein [Vogesella sp. AC12]
MPSLAIFEDDAFSLSTLTVAINEGPQTPGRLAALGLFEEEGITSTTVEIEKEGNTLSLVAAGERGGSGQQVGGDKRSLLNFSTIHLPQQSVIRADEVTNLRAFGSETEVETVQAVVSKRLNKHKRQLDATTEYHRIGAVKGLVMDADGQRVLLDIYHHFQIEQDEIEIDLSATGPNLRGQCLKVVEAVEEALGSASSTGVRVFCGKNIWAALVANKYLEETFKYGPQAAALRGDPRDTIEFGGMVWERYTGKVGTIAFIDPDLAYVVPEGVPDMFITRFAPADHVDSVGTMGLPYYTSLELLRHGKGVDMLSQSNVLNLNTRPAAVIRLKLKAA